jgi:alpha-L-fucosidase
VAWQRLELTGFAHFGMNTMTDREWGSGHEDPALFDPDALDADQWVAAFAAAGMRGVILTAKHHDGFCLWPSRVSRHTVAASPWRGGRGDLVGEVAAACARRGLRFGVYLSPWDRTEPTYGSGRPYDDHFVAQLTELLTGYGPVFSVWLDGANGEGPDGRVQRYDWDRYVRVVRELQADAVVSVCGPDVRWCGNEAGSTRADEWSVVPASLRDAEGTASRSQQEDDAAFSRQVRSDEEDLGSRRVVVASDQPLVWYPAEVNTSIRPGWFHHPAEDDRVRSTDELFDLWLRSTGGNSVLLVNVPPTRHGLVHEADVAALAGLGERIASFWARDVTGDAVEDGQALRWTEPRILEAVVIEEDIEHGQQIDELVLETAGEDGRFVEAARVHAVGYRRIVRLPASPVSALKVRVVQQRGPVHLRPLRVIAAPSDPSGVSAARRAR